MPNVTSDSLAVGGELALPVLAFDWGQRHIGVALVTQVPRIPIPLKTIPATRGQADHKVLDQLIKQHTPSTLVVGLPLNMDGTESAQTRKARRFATHLQGRYQLPVEFVDERLTTKEAQYRTGVTDPDHAHAALVIAESWLNEQS